eukprot:m.149131 g.149131  ORF g.149131 m.149131 type:complete len:374 (+) comp38510_c0_seq9:1349-2470(+)
MAASIGPWNGDVCLVLEFAANASLSHQLHTSMNLFTIEEASEIMLGVAKGMQYVHKTGYAHCYLNSRSVLLTKSCSKVCNFDYARKIGDCSRDGAVSDFLEMYPWLAEEQLQGMAPDDASDVYSFGCVYWECLAGSTPWSSIDVLSIPKVVCNQHRRLERKREWPSNIKHLLEQCFEKRERRLDFDEVCRKLTSIVKDSPDNDPYFPKNVIRTEDSDQEGLVWDEAFLFRESLLGNRQRQRDYVVRCRQRVFQAGSSASCSSVRPILKASSSSSRTLSRERLSCQLRNIHFFDQEEGAVKTEEECSGGCSPQSGEKCQGELSCEIFKELPFLSPGNEREESKESTAAESPPPPSSLSSSSSSSLLSLSRDENK